MKFFLKILILIVSIFVGSFSFAADQTVTKQIVFNVDYNAGESQYEVDEDELSSLTENLSAVGIVTPSSSNIASTPIITFNYQIEIDAGEGSSILVPVSTVMDAGSSVDFSDMTASTDVSVGDFPSANGTIVNSVRYGLTSDSLSLDRSITIRINVGATYNDQTLDVYKKSPGGSWESFTTCVVSSGLCVFTTTSLSSFVAVLPASSSEEAVVVSTGGGGSPSSVQSQLTENSVREAEVKNLNIEEESNKVTISWSADTPTRSVISWSTSLGQYDSIRYMSGSVSENLFEKDHSVDIEGLIPNTKYFFKIEAETTFEGELTTVGEFQTKASKDEEAPSNVRNLRILSGRDGIVLRWDNPLDEDFGFVRIMRSEDFYPQGPFEGKLIYENDGNFVEDNEVREKKVYYYTVFARDTNGNYSSGAIAAAVFSKIDILEPGEVRVAEPGIVIPDIDIVDVAYFDFTQGGKKVGISEDQEGDVLRVVSGERLDISVKYESLPDEVEAAIVTMSSQDNGKDKFSFLLKPNDEKGVYESSVDKFENIGKYDITIFLIDKENHILRKINATFEVKESEARSAFLVFIEKTIEKIVQLFQALWMWVVGVLDHSS